MNSENPNNPGPTPRPSPSTGPRTEAGKSVSSQNARKHDLCSRTLRLSPEEWVEYNDMRALYCRDLQPANDVEQTSIDEICFNYWRLQQAREVELKIIAEHPFDLPVIALYIRYRTSYERGYYKALDQLQKTQRERKKQQAAGDSAASASVPVAAVPLAAVPLAPVPLAPVRSAERVKLEAAELQEQIENHALENEFRAKLHLEPLPMPQQLASQLDRFVSQNPAALTVDLLSLSKEAA